MKDSFEFRFDESFIVAALRRDLLWKGDVVAAALVVVAIAAHFWFGGWSLVTSACVAGAVTVVVVLRFRLRHAARQVDQVWRFQAPDGIVRYELDDDGFDVILGSSRSRFEWANLRRLWRYNDVWLIEFVRMQSVFFPPNQLRQETLDYISERCESADIRVAP